MKIVKRLVKGLAAVPLLTACVSFAGGNLDDVEEPKASTSEEDSAEVDPLSKSTGRTEGGQDAVTASDVERPLQDEPLVLGLSDLTDADGIGDLSLQWQEYDEDRGRWTKVEGAQSSGFTPRQQHVGNRLRVSIEYIDGLGNLESILTEPTPSVQNVNDAPTGKLEVVGTQREYETLKADTSNIRDKDGIGSFEYFWEISADGERWARHRADEWQGDSVTLSQREVGQYLRAVIEYTDGYGTEERVNSAATDPIENVNDSVQGDLVVTGEALVGKSLRADPSGLRDRDGIANITLVWESSADGQMWQRLGESPDGRLEMTSDIRGLQVRAVATVVDRFGNEGTVVSSKQGPVDALNSEPSGTIKILSVD
ncbi:MAG: hypothetical protein FKY71_06150 [Spiribacter salinus]|uniref:Uncharacterized protein n=1 Tax=Spiribacter salinus TaxID=1335746 RepID=A0A540VT20_9GAMM|nr:MAG: hypothetical protein FKY71_06150 [Spiribacter salinus]